MHSFSAIPARSRIPRRLRVPALALIGATLLAACATPTVPVPPCCYIGAVSLSRFDTLSLEMKDGARVPIRDALPGFRPAAGSIAPTYPVFEGIEIPRVASEPLETVLPKYDANGNTILEPEELSVFYLVEAARGLGAPAVAVIDDNHRIGALATAPADAGGLMRFIHRNNARFSSDARAMFWDLETLEEEQRDIDGPDIEENR